MAMRLLFITNFYPPASRGGYEQWCQEVAMGLRARNHEIAVLTSRHGQDQLAEPDPRWVRRELHLEMEFVSLRNGLQFFTSRKTHEKENLARLRQLLADYAPDGILIWGMWNLPRSIPALAEAMLPGRVAYYMGDYWPTLPSQYDFYWQAPARTWATALPKLILRPIARRMLDQNAEPDLKFAHIMFPSVFMRDEFMRQDIPFQETRIVYGGIDTGLYQFRNGAAGTPENGHLSLLYIGRLAPEKGVHTAIQALGHLMHQHKFENSNLVIAGSGEADYEAHLHRLARQEEVESSVTFLGSQPKEAMPGLYSQADVLLFTSVWPEPFGRVLIEAMAAGVVVIGTATGGAGEILIDNENALVFSPADPIGLAARIMRLAGSPSLRQQLAQTGRRTAVERFDIHRMTGEIEAYLQAIVNDR
jgi:glycogen(starch) synthase